MEKGASEIVKLTERIAKDPKSKLFVPLAEEYKKVGDIEMAIQVLQEGLKNNPTYVTARSFLGRLLMESGDLPGAQKELEEVIKAIPDNLLAQRKLADLFILTGRNAEAVERYKTVLALNPGDKEVKALLADLEAGKDISDRIPKPKARPPAPAAEAPEPKAAAVPPKTAAAPPTAAAAAVSQPPKPAPTAAPPKQATAVPPAPAVTGVATPKQQAVSASVPPKAGVGPAPAGTSAGASDMAVEEIVELEHLEQPEAAAEPVVAPGTVAPAAQAPAAVEPAFDLAEGASFDLTEGAGEAGAFPGEPEAVKWEPHATMGTPIAPGETAAVSWEPPTAEEAPLAVEPGSENWEPPAPPAAAKPAPETADSGTSDDINTNTLAELYITQGFYEKAIEIYEGMLAENPGNVALQKKLAKIRSMAGVAEQNAMFTAPVAEPSTDAAKVDVFAADAEAGGVQAPAAQRTPEPDMQPPVPPVAAEPALPRTAPSIAAAPSAGPQAASARRKETIDRLESWLKNIIKEKP